MSHEQGRVAHVLERLAFHRTEEEYLGTSLCTTAAEVIELPGAAIMLMVKGKVHPVGICGAVMEVVEDLQVVHGEGPCIDAQHLGVPVSEPDLAAPVDPRWVGFTPRAVDAGVRAVFGYPLNVGGRCIGALNLCDERPGGLSGAQHRDALVVADVAVQSILASQADLPLGELAPDLIDEGSHQLVVNQAVGMVAVQIGGSVEEAFLRLRAHAFVSGRRLSEVAQDVVDRTLRLEP